MDGFGLRAGKSNAQLRELEFLLGAMRIGEAAKRLGVTTGTLRRWEREGKFVPAFRTVGGERRYTSSQVAEFAGEAVGNV